jgi:hypothetical protein
MVQETRLTFICFAFEEAGSSSGLIWIKEIGQPKERGWYCIICTLYSNFEVHLIHWWTPHWRQPKCHIG